MAFQVEIHWADPDRVERLWGKRGVLYALLDPPTRKIQYIGKAWDCTPRQRIGSHVNNGRVASVLHPMGIKQVEPIVGEFVFEGRFTRQLVDDVESLLIYRLMPCANQQCTMSRIDRPGLIVECRGDAWPHERRRFIDR